MAAWKATHPPPVYSEAITTATLQLSKMIETSASSNQSEKKSDDLPFFVMNKVQASVSA